MRRHAPGLVSACAAFAPQWPAYADDEELAVVELTENGRRILEDGAPLWQGAQDRIEARLGTDAAAQLKELLQTL